MGNLADNLDKLHTTPLGEERIGRNIGLNTCDVLAWCKEKIERPDKIVRKGKNWYVHADNTTITVNAHSYTVITAHKNKKELMTT